MGVGVAVKIWRAVLRFALDRQAGCSNNCGWDAGDFLAGKFLLEFLEHPGFTQKKRRLAVGMLKSPAVWSVPPVFVRRPAGLQNPQEMGFRWDGVVVV